MKARKIRKIRARLGELQTYKVRESFLMFGDFHGNNMACVTCSDTDVSATDPIRALKIYMKRYRLKNKQRHENESSDYSETSENWGFFMVTDEKGYKRYYK